MTDEPPGLLEATSEPPLQRPQGAGAERPWRSALLTFVMLYLFIAAINMMGAGLKVAARDDATNAKIQAVFSFADNPFVGFCVGLLVTSVVQSSSFTTSMLVMFVAHGEMTLVQAIPVIMGANVGTSITALLVSLGHIRRRREFRLALSGAATHSWFKILTMCIMLPLELAFGVLSRPAAAIGDWLGHTRAFAYDPNSFNPIKAAVGPISDLFKWLTLDVMGLSRAWAGCLIAVAALLVLFSALFFLVVGLKGLLMHRIGSLFRRVLFARPWTGFMIGIAATALIQSSSVTTSLAVPLLGAGVLSLTQVYPYILGADIGTTVTAILASLAAAATAGDAAVASLGLSVAAAHLLFNVFGVAVFWPLQAVPIALGNAFSRAASRRRIWVLVGLLGVFFVMPTIVVVLVAFLR